MRLVTATLGRLIDLLMAAGLLLILGGGAWLQPHQPIDQPDAFIMEGYFSDSLFQAATHYLHSHPELPVYLTGHMRPDFHGPLPGPGRLTWDFGTFTSRDSNHIQLRFHGFGGEQQTEWRVQLNDSVYLDRPLDNYDSQQFTWHLPPGMLRSISVQGHHPAPDSSCAFVLWYLIVEGMQENGEQRLWFQPQGADSAKQAIPVTLAEVMRERLIRAGISPDRVIATPPALTDTDRTRTAAEAFSDWVAQSNRQPERINLIGSGFHARRSYEAYRQALGERVSHVGVVRVTGEGRNQWWTLPRETQWEYLGQLARYLGWRIFG